MHAVALSVSDGGPVVEQMQVVKCRLPNWLVFLFHDAGTNSELAQQFPERVEIDVAIDVAARTIASLDVESAIQEHAAYRPAAVAHWKLTDSPLAPVRMAFKLPGLAVRGAKAVVREAKSVAGEITDIFDNDPTKAPKRSWNDAEIEQLRRTANIQAHRWQKYPKEREAARQRALKTLPMQIDSFKGGFLHEKDLETLVMVELVSTAITQDEADGFLAAAGLTPPV